MPSTVVSVWMRHDFKCFYFCINMFNDNPFSGKAFVIHLIHIA